MKIPLQISSRKLFLSRSVKETIQQKAMKLEQFYDKIIGCKVMLDTPHRHKNHGILYNVSIEVSIPGADLVVKKEKHEDLQIAVREAFDAARRQLLSHNRKKRDKQTESLHHGFIAEMLTKESDAQSETIHVS